MKPLPSACLAAFAILVMAADAHAQYAAAPDVSGLWYARGRFGPDVAGRLVVDRSAGEWRASIAGRTAAVRIANDSVSFDLPDGSGSFLGRRDGRGRITGSWIQPPLVTEGWRSASAVVLESCGTDCFAGTAAPRADEFTFYLDVNRRADGTLGVLLRNPERNLARFLRATRIVADSSGVRLLDARDTTVARGLLREDAMSLYIPGRGGSYDFRRVPEDAFTFFYPRGRPTSSYHYVPPADRGDGWPVGSLDEVGISREQISAFIETLASAPVDSLGALKVHGLLIARHGRLVLEEYFYGEHGEKPHETRSASKTVLTVLVGAAMQAGMQIGPETRVYDVMRPGARDLDPRKRALTLDHLLTMSSGLDCDDDGEERPGNESNITDQDENPDWYGMILDLDMIRDPGERSVYCSINPHLGGGVLARATVRSLPDLMYELVAEPLGMRNYHVPLTPLGDGYFGGGWKFRPRDFMKLGQLYQNGGTWQGRRVLSEEWIRRSTADRYPMGSSARYGYLWWMREYPYGDRTVRAYYMTGNGGQIVVVIPDLDLVIAAYGGNYNERAGGLMVGDLIPRYILPAITADE